MKKLFNDYFFVFPKTTRTSILLLLLLLTLMIVFWILLPYIFTADENVLQESTALQTKWKEHQLQNDNKSIVNNYAAISTDKKINPNTATTDEMLQVGFPKAIALTIEKFRNKGGKFKSIEELKKIYTITPEIYDRVAPYIEIPTYSKENKIRLPEKENKKPYTNTNQLLSININTATEIEFMRVRGIGKGYAKRILDKRNQLGGFYSITQLREIYNFPDSVYFELEKIAIIDAKDIHKINVNTATEEHLAAHPYIGKQLAKNIIRLRTDMQKFKEITDLKHTPLINEEKYRKIAHYIYIE